MASWVDLDILEWMRTPWFLSFNSLSLSFGKGFGGFFGRDMVENHIKKRVAEKERESEDGKKKESVC